MLMHQIARKSEARASTGRRWLIAVLFAVGLLCSAASPGSPFDSTSATILQICGLLLPLIAAFIWARPFFQVRAYRESAITTMLVSAFLISSGLSAAIATTQQGSSYPLIFSIGMVSSFIVYGVVWNFGEDRIRFSLEVYCILCTAFTLLTWVSTREPGARFGGVFHPNYWGLLCFTNFCLAFLIKSTVLRSAIQIGNILVIFDAQARSAILAITTAGIILAYFGWRTMRVRQNEKLLILLTGILMCAALGFFLRNEWFMFFSETFRLDDQYRGTASGFTGRTELWEDGWEIFKQNPFFGIGPRMEANYMQDNATNAHSGYISIFSQYGAIGASLFFTLALIRIVKLWSQAIESRPMANVGTAFICGYGVNAIFDPKLLNIGNPVSLLMLMFLFLPTGGSRRKLPFAPSRHVSM